MATRKVRVGILGAAKIAPGALIAPAKQRDDVELVAVAARDPARAEAFAAAHGLPFTSASYSELIAREDIDLVYVALHISAHAEWSIRALEAGKAVLCEKPFAFSAGEARAMVAAAEAAGRPLIEAFHYRHHPVLRRAFEMAADGALGSLIDAEALFEVTIPYAPEELRWRADLGGGALMDLGCYCVHALRTLAGEPEVTAAKARMARGVDAAMEVSLTFPGGVTARLATAMDPERPVARLRLKGEKGSLEITPFVAPQLGCQFTLDLGEGPVSQPAEGPTTFACQLAHVVDVMLHGATPLTGGADAIANMVAIDAIYETAGVARAR
jgi:predicted dehydrogenase